MSPPAPIGTDTWRVQLSPDGASVPFAVLARSVLADTRLKPSDKIVLLALQEWSRQTVACIPSNQTIATYCGLSLATVKRSLVALAKLGFIGVPEVKTHPRRRILALLWLRDPDLRPQCGESEAQCGPPCSGGPQADLGLAPACTTVESRRKKKGERCANTIAPRFPTVESSVSPSAVSPICYTRGEHDHNVSPRCPHV